MELVEGPTLADRIARGPIPLDEALPIAKQIAEALEAAHEQGIIHRDLKPANVKVRLDGTVKVLDFGLAKALDPAQVRASAAQGDITNSPTITSPATTQMGMILGTAAYMSPEQARGRAVDKRADIWAFGVVLYEMLTGKRLFSGEDVSDTMAAVLRQTIAFGELPEQTPAAVRVLIERCLERDIRQRLRDIGEARVSLERMLLPGGGSGPMRLRPASRRLAHERSCRGCCSRQPLPHSRPCSRSGVRRRLAVRPPSHVFGWALACRVLSRSTLVPRRSSLRTAARSSSACAMRERRDSMRAASIRLRPSSSPGASKPPIRFFLPTEARLDSSRPGRSRRCHSREGP